MTQKKAFYRVFRSLIPRLSHGTILGPHVLKLEIPSSQKSQNMYIGLGTVVLIIILYLIFRRR